MPVVDYEKRANLAFHRLMNDPRISKENKAQFLEFSRNYRYSHARKTIVYEKLRVLFHHSHNFQKDMHQKARMMEILDKLHRDKPGYFETIRNNALMYGRRLNDAEPVKALKEAFHVFPLKKEKRRIPPEKLLNLGNRDQFLKYLQTIQLKAILSTQLDGGFRPSEFNDLNYGDVERINPPYVWIAVRKGKTGPRSVWLFRASPYFLKWYEAHPTKKRNDPLWLQEFYTSGEIRRYQVTAQVKRLKRIREESGCPELSGKLLDFYALRHGAVACAKSDNIPVEDAAKKFGHSIEEFLNTYGQLGWQDKEDRLGSALNLPKAEKPKINEFLICRRCNMVNGKKETFCLYCSLQFSENLEKNSHIPSVKKVDSMRHQLDTMNSFMDRIIKNNPTLAKEIAKEGLKQDGLRSFED